MADHLFYQHGDEPDAANFAQAHGTATHTSYIVSGLELTNPDYTAPTVDITSGVAVIYRGDYDTASPNIDPQETRSDAAHPLEKDGETLSLTDSALNHIYLDLNAGTDDTPLFDTNTTGAAPSASSFKIGEVDTSTDTLSSQWNLISSQGAITFPTDTALESAASRFDAGTPLFDRAGEQLYEVTSSGVQQLVTKEYVDSTFVDEPTLRSEFRGFVQRGHLESGLELTNVDYTTPSVDVNGGRVVVVNSDRVATHEVSATTGVSLTDGTINNVFVETAGDLTSPSITVTTSGTPSEPSVKIGEVDTTNDTLSSQWNLTADDGTLSYPNEDAADEAALNLQAGTVVYARTEQTHYYVD